MSVRHRLKRFFARAWRFSTVGVGNALVDIGTLNLLLLLFPAGGTLRIVAYNGVALLLANANSYLWNTLWTFHEKARGSAQQRVLFAVQALVNIGVNAGLFWVAINLIFLYTDFSATVAGNLAKVLSTIVAFGVSFFILRHLVFSGKPWRSRPHSQPVKEREDVGERESGPEIR